MLNAIVGFLVLGSVALIILMWKTAKVWRWYQLFAVFCVYALACFLPFPTAGILKCRSAWHKKKEEMEKRAAEVEKEHFELLYGSLTDETGGQGVFQMKSKLNKIAVESGRRWPGLRLNNPNIQNLVLTNPPQEAPAAAPVGDDPGGEPDADAAKKAAPANLVPVDSVVYGFAEGIFEGTDRAVPIFYLGEFRVMQSTPAQVTLRPTAALESFQADHITNGNAPNWVLYEMLPLDGHSPYLVEGTSQNKENMFGSVNEDLVRSLFGDRLREKTLQKYLQDGNRWSVATARLKAAQPEDPAADPAAAPADDEGEDKGEDPLISRWTKVEFTKPYKNKYDVDSPNDNPATEGNFFDASGRAMDRRLKFSPPGGDPVTIDFNTKDQVIVKERERIKLKNVENAAKIIDDYYVRPLIDFRYVMPSLRMRLSEAALRKKELEFEKGVLDDAINATNSTLTLSQVEKGNLEKDFAQIELEVKALREYKDSVDKLVKGTRDRLRQLYRQNQQLEQQLRALHGLQSTVPANAKPAAPAAPKRKPANDFAQAAG